jgi:hypothetical protein
MPIVRRVKVEVEVGALDLRQQGRLNCIIGSQAKQCTGPLPTHTLT